MQGVRTHRVGRWLLRIIGLLLLLLLVAAGLLWLALDRSKPAANGVLPLAGLSAPVSIERDELGVPRITAANRTDLARALGFLHGQERLFQMDMLRRVAAGELSTLMGRATLDMDRRVRVHRFRARARAIVSTMPAAERALLAAYVAGVNAGAAALDGRPWEYWLLRARPAPWAAEDTVLAVFAMYLQLQPIVPQRELDRAIAEKAGGRALADLLFPPGTALDAPLDGSTLPPPAISAVRAAVPATGPDADVRLPEMAGSNNWAVGGALTATGAALVANDMHLGLSVPAIWYRAQMRAEGFDLNGVTLPGTPFLVAGSNGHVAWGFTNSYIDTADAVIVEWLDADRYRTPEGAATITRHRESLCARSRCEELEVRETIWGPIIGEDALGRSIAMRWTAHDAGAVRLTPAIALEQARDTGEALALAQQAGIPQQNFVVGDRQGQIGWTIIGPVPRRIGFSGQDAASFADGSKRWDGMLTPAETPAVQNPADARIWTANNRVVGGDAYARLGDGGYDNGARAGRIRDLLRAREQFTPADFLAIQLDDTATRNRFWQALMLTALKQADDPRLTAMLPLVRDWGERAVPESAGYRMVDRFRRVLIEEIYAGLMGKPEDGNRRSYVPGNGEGTARRLLTERPPALVPHGHADWDALIRHALDDVADDIRRNAGGDPARYLWRDVGRAGVSHPLARAFTPLGWLLNPREQSLPGDRPTVRAQAPGFGASQRFAVQPGREDEGLFHMPGGNSGHPLAPWYLAGHHDWTEGRPTPFLPGPPRTTLTLMP